MPSSSFDLQRLFQLWLIDDETTKRLGALRPLIAASLAGHEAEFDQAFLSDPRGELILKDAVTRQREVEALSRFWNAVFQSELDEAEIELAAELGRQHLELGLGGRYFLAASQRVLRRAIDAIIAAELPEPHKAVDAVTRLVLLGADVALTAYHDSVADLVSQIEVHRETEELHEQVRALEELAHVDALTRLFNRRHFNKSLDAEISRAQRYRQPLCLIMADVDHFKRVNDTYGHTVGDLVLCHVALILQTEARRSDIVARYGGEEFALILTATPGERGQLVAERMRLALEAQPVTLADGTVLALTMSLGVAAFDGDEAPISLVERADAALYRAKQGGRNRVSE